MDNNQKFIVLDIGCGKRPTLGSFIAHMRRNTTIFSIDPQVDTGPFKKVDWAKSDGFLAEVRNASIYKGLYKALDNLYLYQSSFENFMSSVILKYSDDYALIACCNHAHVTLNSILKYLPRPCHYFTNPCCHDNVPTSIQGIFIKDKHIWSPKNRIYYCHLTEENKRKSK
jgi:hypothetical protein